VAVVVGTGVVVVGVVMGAMVVVVVVGTVGAVVVMVVGVVEGATVVTVVGMAVCVVEADVLCRSGHCRLGTQDASGVVGPVDVVVVTAGGGSEGKGGVSASWQVSREIQGERL